MLGIRKGALNLKRAGLEIHLIQSVSNLPLVRENGVVRKNKPDGQAYAASDVLRLLIGKIFGFAHLEANPDRIERDDGCQWLGGCFRNKTSDLDQAIADTARDGRGNGGVTKIQFGSAQKSFAGNDLGSSGIDIRPRLQTGLTQHSR